MLTVMPRRRKSARGDGLRVAIVAETFLPNMNGVTNSVLRVIDGLVERGHEAMVIAPGPGDDHYGSTPVIRIPGFDLPRYEALRIGLPVGRLASRLREFDADVVHLAAPAVLGVAGARAAERAGIPSVAIYQTDLAGFARRYGLSRFEPTVWRWLRWVHSHADLTLAPSTSAMWALQAHGIGNVARWTRGVDLQRFDPAHRSDLLRRRLAPNGEQLVGYIGRLAKEKQVERLAPLTRIPGVRVVVVGDGPEKEALQALMPNALFLGFLRGAELGQAMASLDVFVHTGLDETFCQTIQEAMASRVAVVAPAAGGPLDLVRHGLSGYLWSPEMPEMLAGAVAELVADPLRRQSLADAGWASVQGRSWNVVLDELVDHYESVIAGGASPRARLTELVA